MTYRLMALGKVNSAAVIMGGFTPLEALYGKHPKRLDSESGHWWGSCLSGVLCAQKNPAGWR